FRVRLVLNGRTLCASPAIGLVGLVGDSSRDRRLFQERGHVGPQPIQRQIGDRSVSVGIPRIGHGAQGWRGEQTPEGNCQSARSRTVHARTSVGRNCTAGRCEPCPPLLLSLRSGANARPEPTPDTGPEKTMKTPDLKGPLTFLG